MSRRGAALSAVLVVAALALGIIVAPGGPDGLALAPYSSSDIVALVPVGWQSEPLVAPYGTTELGWIDPGNSLASELIAATRAASPSPIARARKLAARLRRRPGYTQSYLGVVHLAGDRSLWSLWYAAGGVRYAIFEFDACAPTIAMTVTLTASSQPALNAEAVAIPQGVEPVCDGTDFSTVDRADPSIPLRLP
jgi:hypothetical protein